MKLKTLCACLTLVTYAGIAMDGPSHTETRNLDKGKASAEKGEEPTSQADLKNLSKEELLRIIADLQQQNADLRQQVKTHESVLAEALDQTVHTRDKKVLKKEYEQLLEATKDEDIKSLIDQGVDVDETVYGKAYTPLMDAMNNGNVNKVKSLLNYGADPKKSPRALEVAVGTGKADLVKLLLEKGANPNVINYEGSSMLLLALEKGYANIAKLFLSDPNNLVLDLLYSGKHQTPISKDSLTLRKGVISFDHYDTPNNYGRSPLIEAISSERISDSDRLVIVESLLKNEVDVNHVDSRLRGSALTLAKRFKRSEKIIELLEKAGAREIETLLPNNKSSAKFRARYGTSPVVQLYQYIQATPGIDLSNLKFEFDNLPGEKFNCTITLNGRIYKIDDLACNSKREAKNKIAEYTLNELLNNGVQSSQNNTTPLRKLNTYLENASIDLSDVEFLYDIHHDGTFSCKIKINDQIFDNHLRCKSKKEAKDRIAEYVYDVLTAKQNEEVSSTRGNYSAEQSEDSSTIKSDSE
ncbi:MAG: ankyrin repeat domain-containing protein [Alphaproteobacteria bacterium]|nr:ankyrin repeat domain-containing protein [Alphaproteobacteria bacterium]